jgi:polyhydroxybutyrate depolymerase
MLWRMVVALTALVLCAACGSDSKNEGAGGSGAQGTGGMGQGGGTTQGCGTGTAMAGTQTITIVHNGVERYYELYLPPSYDDSTALPLVLNFHGFTSSASEQAFFSGMNPLADSEGFAVVYPEGTAKSWNGGPICCGTAASEDIDDVDFTRQIVADVAARACIDETRVYATGMSNGGFMSHRLACEASDLVAAVAPVDGLLGVPSSSCTPGRNVPMIHFYGTADPLVEYDFAIQTNDHWVSTYACTDAAPEVTYMQGTATCETWDECAGGAKVTFCSMEGMGHCWPGQSFCPPSLGASTTDISANAEMWAFFQQYAL